VRPSVSPRVVGSLLLLFALAGSALAAPRPATADVPAPTHLLRVGLGEAVTLDSLRAGGYDIVAVRGGAWVDLLARPDDEARLAARGAGFTVLDDAVERHYAERAARELALRPAPEPARVLSAVHPDGLFRVEALPPFGSGSMGGYWTLDEVKMKLDSLVASDTRDLVADQLDTLGTTWQGRPIWGLRLGKAAEGPDGRPAVFFNALTHAREPEGMQALFRFVDDLLAKYDTDDFARYLLDQRVIHICPVVNPDGYARNQATDPAGGGLWRKNARDNDGDGIWLESGEGVDLNRNFGYRWGYDNVGSSGIAANETYRGPAAFSEPETAVQRDLITALAPATGISFHTYGGYFLHPWGYVAQAAPDSAAFDEWDDEATLGAAYLAGPGSRALYTTNGDFNDWTYGDTLTKPRAYSWSPEVGTQEDGFWPAPSRIVPLAEENLRKCYTVAAIAGPYVRVESHALLEGTLDAGHFAHLALRLRNRGLAATPANLAATLVALDEGVTVGGTAAAVAYPALPSRGSADATGGATFLLAAADTVTPGRRVRFEARFTADDGYFSRDTVELRLGTPTVLATEACDALTGWTSSAGWGVVSNDPTHPDRYLNDSPSGAYANNANLRLVRRGRLDLSAGVHAWVRLEARWFLEQAYDGTLVEASLDSVTWTPLAGRATTPGVYSPQPEGAPIYQAARRLWQEEWLDLSPFAGPAGGAVSLRLRTVSDSGTRYDGFSFDSLCVLLYDPAAQPAPVAVGPAARSGLELAAPWPNPARRTAHLGFSLPRAGTLDLAIHDVQGRLVRTLAGGPRAAGQYALGWDLRDDAGHRVAPGLYLVRMSGTVGGRTRRVVVLP
jgi:carboxypeptidase T